MTLVEKGSARLEVTIGRDVVEKMKILANKRGCHLWEIVEAACLAYEHTATGNKDGN
jgi:hypothetical protein